MQDCKIVSYNLLNRNVCFIKNVHVKNNNIGFFSYVVSKVRTKTTGRATNPPPVSRPGSPEKLGHNLSAIHYFFSDSLPAPFPPKQNVWQKFKP